MRYLLIIAFLFIPLWGFNQCTNFHIGQCELPLDWSYEYNSQSLDAEVIPGQTIKLKVVIYEGFDYFFGFCKSEGFGEISYQLITQDNEYIADQSNAKSYNNIDYVEISSASTSMILILIKTQKMSATNIDFDNRKCLGIIIGNKQTEN
jgi:hypothetical protein